MALLILNNTGTPYGQFDGYDGTAMLGGEVATLAGIAVNSTDKKAKDVDDGYANSLLAPFQRPIVSTTLASGTRPLFLTDEGTGGGTAGFAYGTLFGTVVGGNAGQSVSGGTVLGPHTAAGSGKVTLWANGGLYGVTLDAVEPGATGLTVANGFLAVGSALTYTSSGKLTPAGGANAVGGAPTVARFVEFTTGDRLVTTPQNLTLLYAGPNALAMKYVVINWNGSALV